MLQEPEEMSDEDEEEIKGVSALWGHQSNQIFSGPWLCCFGSVFFSADWRNRESPGAGNDCNF